MYSSKNSLPPQFYTSLPLTNAPAVQTPLKPQNTLSQAAALFSKLSADRTPLNPSFRVVPACKPRFTQVLPHATLQQAAIPLQLLNIFLYRPSNSVPSRKHCCGRKLSLRLRRRRSGIQILFCRPIILPFSLRIAVLLPIINPIPIMQFFYH